MSELVFSDVSVRLSGKTIVSGVSLRLAPGALVALIGPNGAGKSTLLRCALGLVQPSAGSASLDGRPIATLSPRERAAALAWLPQYAPSGEALSTLDVVASARFRFRESRRAEERAARAALERVGMASHAAARITELSGGERQRVSIAALLAQEARLLLLDEPANHLDPAQQLETYRLLGELWADDFGLLLITHDVNLLAHLGAPERVQLLGLAGGRPQFETVYGAPDLAARLESLFAIPFATYGDAARRVLVPSALAAPPHAPRMGR